LRAGRFAAFFATFFAGRFAAFFAGRFAAFFAGRFAAFFAGRFAAFFAGRFAAFFATFFAGRFAAFLTVRFTAFFATFFAGRFAAFLTVRLTAFLATLRTALFAGAFLAAFFTAATFASRVVGPGSVAGTCSRTLTENIVKFVHIHVGVSFRVARVLCDALFFRATTQLDSPDWSLCATSDIILHYD
jgi:hypothetical protein